MFRDVTFSRFDSSHSFLSCLQVVDFLKCKPDQISGTPHSATLCEEFLTAMERNFPGEVANLAQEAALKKAKPVTLWDTMKAPKSEAAVFSFGF
jgi:hypothetical protein